MTATLTTSPLQLRSYAMECGVAQFAGDLMVTCDGKFVIKGRYATLNEAIMACGRYNLAQAAG